MHRIDEQLAKAMDRKVWLPSGGTLVIDRTEAMTVVDVNTGKFTGAGGNLEQTVTKNNLEAAEEIVRQLRLRDIGGIVVIDFIDMVLESNRDLVLRRLTEALARDRTRHQVSEVTSLGLVQLTRKKLGTGLIEAFSTNCPECSGRGIVLHADPVETTRRRGRSQVRDRRRPPQPARQEGPRRRTSGGAGGGAGARPRPRRAPDVQGDGRGQRARTRTRTPRRSRRELGRRSTPRRSPRIADGDLDEDRSTTTSTTTTTRTTTTTTRTTTTMTTTTIDDDDDDDDDDRRRRRRR